MTKIRVTKEFSFEIAHALWNYDGPCKNLHGHSYKLFVTVIGTPINDKSNPKNGMLIDFGDLKKIVSKEIVDRFDHSVLVSEDSLKHQKFNIEQMFENTHVMKFQPTCENMVADFAERLIPLLPDNLKLHSIVLYETATSRAEWFASDNI